MISERSLSPSRVSVKKGLGMLSLESRRGVTSDASGKVRFEGLGVAQTAGVRTWAVMRSCTRPALRRIKLASVSCSACSMRASIREL